MHTTKPYLLYPIITALTRIRGKAKPKLAKLTATATSPLWVIDLPLPNSENYNLKDPTEKAVGYGKKVGNFIVQFRAPAHGKRHPTWMQILEQLPEKWAKEGIALWLNTHSFKRIVPQEGSPAYNAEMQVAVYYKEPTCEKVFTRKQLKDKSKKFLQELYDSMKASESMYHPDDIMLVEYLYHKRIKPYANEYLKYLQHDSIDVDRITTLMYDCPNITMNALPAEKDRVEKLKRDMLRNSHHYWKYQIWKHQNIDVKT